MELLIWQHGFGHCVRQSWHVKCFQHLQFPTLKFLRLIHIGYIHVVSVCNTYLFRCKPWSLQWDFQVRACMHSWMCVINSKPFAPFMVKQGEREMEVSHPSHPILVELKQRIRRDQKIPKCGRTSASVEAGLMSTQDLYHPHTVHPMERNGGFLLM